MHEDLLCVQGCFDRPAGDLSASIGAFGLSRQSLEPKKILASFLSSMDHRQGSKTCRARAAPFPCKETFMLPSILRVLLPLALILGLFAVVRSADAPPPASPKHPVTDTYHNVTVRDDYRWLENPADPAVRKWTEEQNRLTRPYFEKLPDLEKIRQRVKDLLGSASPDYTGLRYQNGLLFALKHQPPKEQPFLIALSSPDAPLKEQVIADPNLFNPKGTTTIDFYVPSQDGKLVAASMSEGGSEEGTLYVFRTGQQAEVPFPIPRVHGGTAGGSAAWNADGTGFWYTRYPRGTERPKADLDFYQQIWFHKLGTRDSEDVYSLGKDFPRIAEVLLETSDNGLYVLASVANGDGGEFAHYVHGPSGTWTQITQFADQVTRVAFGPDDTLYLLSRKEAPRGKLLRLGLASPQLAKAELIVPQSEAAIQDFTATASLLYVHDLIGGPSQLRVFDRDGKARKPVPLPPIASVGQVVRMKGDEVLVRIETYVEPPAWYRYDPKDDKVTRTGLFRTSPVDFTDVEVERVFATSKDGTKVPLNILKRKGTKLDGTNPTLLYGYGGYNISQTPRFRVGTHIWLEQGGVYAIANLRGGGEYGEEWHKAGNLTHKQNVFDDFAACAQYLIEQKYTNPKRLAIEGGSNGGLLMGAALTQHPDLFRAVVSHVGIYDMLRVELHPNGAFNVTEFGTVKDPEQFRALYAYSPYHHVKDGTAYPAVFFLTGDNDARVDPANSRKMTARLQAATSSGLPILLRTSSSSGHGVDSSLSERIAEQTEVYAFLFHELSMEFKPVR
jgi:prolyl oligopeptidase